MISRPSFHKCMKSIKCASMQRQKDYEKIQSVLGDCEKILEMSDITPMVDMLTQVCDDIRGFICQYIYDNNWGNAGLTVEDENGRRYAFDTVDDLYDVLNHPKVWELKIVFAS